MFAGNNGILHRNVAEAKAQLRRQPKPLVSAKPIVIRPLPVFDEGFGVDAGGSGITLAAQFFRVALRVGDDGEHLGFHVGHEFVALRGKELADGAAVNFFLESVAHDAVELHGANTAGVAPPRLGM